jgi:hypothetical protein
MAVTINLVTPGSDNVRVQWQAVPMPINTATLYVAANQADLNTPNGLSVPADQSGILPATPLTGTIPGLSSGTNYFCVAEADGNLSAVQPFITGGAAAPTAHLIAKGDDDDDQEPCYEVRKGRSVELKIRALKIGDSGTRLSGIAVNFIVTDGQACGQLAQTSAVSNVHGSVKVAFTGTQPGKTQVTVSSPQADNQAVLDIEIHP